MSPLPRLRFRFLLLSLLPGLAALTLRAADVSRDLPPDFREHVAGLLLPLEEVLKLPPAPGESEAPGAQLLGETVHWIDDTGRRVLVMRRIYRANDESGVRDAAEETYRYRKSTQTISLLTARTILPDGRRIPVQPGAILLQTPQREADEGVYNDEGELKIIFPNVKPGTVVESAVVIAEKTFRIPGEWTAAEAWAGGWPTRLRRCVVELPPAMAARLKITPLGRPVPEAVRTALPDGRVRSTWEAHNLVSAPREKNPAPVWQTGPALWLSTLTDWDELARWYRAQTLDRSKLQPALSKQAESWTHGIERPEEILATLFRHVARDVRYTGLEFGDADLRPHDCNEVWENQYGDCKDKANLLCALLRHAGLSADLALINTNHAGRIERRSPDYRPFTHAIVAVHLHPGENLFCDPTIPFAEPGLLAPDDGDRDTLLIAAEGAKWAHTPPQSAGALSYDFDLRLAADGELSGWMTRDTSGYNAASQADFFRGLGTEATRSSAGRSLRLYFKGAEVVDATTTPLEQWNGTYQTRAYFRQPAGGENGGSQALAFPWHEGVLPESATDATRRSPLFLWRNDETVTARFTLPPGFVPASLPPPYHVTTPALAITAEWKFANGRCDARLELHTKQSIVLPEEWGLFRQTISSLRAWLDRPLLLSATGATPAAPPASGITPENFPLMPSGEGQLDLVDQRFPSDGDPALRRAALEQVLQYFPGDVSTLFDARMRLAIVDWNEKKPEVALQSIRALLASASPSITRHQRAWGEYLTGVILSETKREEEALPVFHRLAAEEGLPPDRRGWSAYREAKIIARKEPAQAIGQLSAAVALESAAQPAQFALLLRLLVEGGHADEAREQLDRLTDRPDAQTAEALKRAAKALPAIFSPAKAAEAEKWLDLLLQASAKLAPSAELKEALTQAREGVRSRSASFAIRQQLREYCEKHPLLPLDAAGLGFKTSAQFVEAAEQATKANDAPRSLRYRLESLLRFDLGNDFPHRLWRATADADWNERVNHKPEPLLVELLDLSDRLPTDDDAFVDGRLLRAKRFERRGDFVTARALHEQLLQLPGLSPGFKVVIESRLAREHEQTRDYPGALAIYRAMEAELTFASAQDAMLRAAYLCLEGEQPEESIQAIGILQRLAGHTGLTLKNAEYAAQLRSLMALAQDPAKARKYWAESATWWPAWEKLAAKLGVKASSGERVVPVIADPEAAKTKLQTFRRVSDRSAYLESLGTFAHAARWNPPLTVDFAEALIYLPSQAPEQVSEIRAFTLALARAHAFEDAALQRRMQLVAVIELVDLGRPAEAVPLLQAFARLPGEEDETAFGMARLGGLVARRLKAGQTEAIAALERALASPLLQSRRAMTALGLADLYADAGRHDDVVKLLQRELEHPAIKGNTKETASLETRLEQARNGGGPADDYTRWLAAHRPAWYDYAEPASLEDRRLTDLEKVLRDPDRLFSPAEVIKLDLLVATSAQQPDEMRQSCFSDALSRLRATARTSQEARALIEPLVSDPGSGAGTRSEALWQAATNAYYEKRYADFESWREHALVPTLSESAREALELFHARARVDENSPEALAGYGAKLLAGEMSPVALAEVRELCERLLNLGAIAQAETLSRSLAGARPAPDAAGQCRSTQMALLKRLELARRWLPVSAAFRQIVLAHGGEVAKPPAEFASLHNIESFAWLEEGTVRRIRLYELTARLVRFDDLQIIRDYLREVPDPAQQRELCLQLTEAGLRLAGGDEDRRTILGFLSLSAADGDDALLNQKLDVLLKPWRDQSQYPATFETIREWELFRSLRAGKPIGESALAGLADREEANILALRQATLSGGATALRKAVEAMSADELLGARVVTYSLPAFEKLGMKAEWGLAGEVARREARKEVLAAWRYFDIVSFGRACRLAAQIHEPELVPAALLREFTDKVQNEKTRWRAEADDAGLRRDWARLLPAAERLNRLLPTHYDYYWWRAEALIELGRKTEAVEPLETFVRYSHDELEYATARERLQELQATAPTAAGS